MPAASGRWSKVAVLSAVVVIVVLTVALRSGRHATEAEPEGQRTARASRPGASGPSRTSGSAIPISAPAAPFVAPAEEKPPLPPEKRVLLQKIYTYVDRNVHRLESEIDDLERSPAPSSASKAEKKRLPL